MNWFISALLQEHVWFSLTPRDIKVSVQGGDYMGRERKVHTKNPFTWVWHPYLSKECVWHFGNMLCHTCGGKENLIHMFRFLASERLLLFLDYCYCSILLSSVLLRNMGNPGYSIQKRNTKGTSELLQGTFIHLFEQVITPEGKRWTLWSCFKRNPGVLCLKEGVWRQAAVHTGGIHLTAKKWEHKSKETQYLRLCGCGFLRGVYLSKK